VRRGPGHSAVNRREDFPHLAKAAQHRQGNGGARRVPVPGWLRLGRGLRILGLLLAAATAALPGPLAPPALAQGALRVGDAPPRVSVAGLEGGQVLRFPDDVRGKVVILHFWAGGCSSCREEMPAMESLQARYGKKGLAILAVNVGQRKAAVRSYVAGMKVSYPIFLDLDTRMAREYEVVGVPKTFILDRSGLIRYKIVGSATMESLSKLVSSLL
jgi:cytochrome c biogenesis protein CcmG, thiol:disulfide interchange protein DsbE